MVFRGAQTTGDINQPSCTTVGAEEGSQPIPHQNKTRGDQSPIDPIKKKTCRKRYQHFPRGPTTVRVKENYDAGDDSSRAKINH